MNITRTTGLAAATLAAALALGACGANEVNKPVASGASASTVPYHPGSSAPTSPPTTAASVAHVGSTLALSDGSGDQANVTLTQVIDPATGNYGGPTDANGNATASRYVATAFTVQNTGSSAITGDANNDVTVTGSDGQEYTADFDDVTQCTNFDDGQFQLGAGESVNGCVVFVIPPNVTVAKVKWSPDSGFSSTFGEWLVP